MPDSRTHEIITLVSGAALLPIAFVFAPDRPVVTAITLVVGHLVSGLAFSCDLDLDSREYQQWGPLRFIWWPYKESIPHRSWISHGLVIGPLLRLAYFGLILYAVLWLLAGVTNQFDLFAAVQQAMIQLLQRYPTQTYAFLIGFILGGAAHSIPDWITTGSKRAWHQWTRI